MNLVAARVLLDLGRPERSLAAARRSGEESPGTVALHAASLREEVRAAVASGDSAAALDAFTAYISSRQNPDSVGRAEVDEITELISRFRSYN
jgi:hypothetical protein